MWKGVRRDGPCRNLKDLSGPRDAEAKGDGTYTVHRAFVTLGTHIGESILIESGLSAGDRVAVAGVTILTEGRVVRLLDASTAAK